MHIWTFQSCGKISLNIILINTCSNDCTAIGRLAGEEGADVYCHYNCLRYPSKCPKEECHCVESIEPSDPNIILDQASAKNKIVNVKKYTDIDGHKVEEYQDQEGKYKIVSVFWKNPWNLVDTNNTSLLEDKRDTAYHITTRQ